MHVKQGVYGYETKQLASGTTNPELNLLETLLIISFDQFYWFIVATLVVQRDSYMTGLKGLFLWDALLCGSLCHIAGRCDCLEHFVHTTSTNELGWPFLPLLHEAAFWWTPAVAKKKKTATANIRQSFLKLNEKKLHFCSAAEFYLNAAKVSITLKLTPCS